MKYLDKNKKQHESPIASMLYNIGTKNTQQTREPKDYVDIDPIITPEPQEERFEQMTKIEISYSTGEIIAIGEDGKEMKRVPIDQKLLKGITGDLIQEMIGAAQITPYEIDLASYNTIYQNKEQIDKLLESEHTVQIDDTSLDMMSKVIDDALKNNPRALRQEGSGFLKKIISDFRDVMNTRKEE